MCPLASDPELPHYQSLQIELTSRCNLSCQTCLRAVSDIHLQEQDLSSSVLERLQPALQRTVTVHLQGWGESMLLDDLPERIRWFKSQGCTVSFTTNGTLMTAGQAEQLVSCGLDGITFSMAGAKENTQDRLRGQGTHARLWQNLQLLQRTKQKQAGKAPSLAVSYLLTPATMPELPQALKQCRPLGLDLFAGVLLTHAATREQELMQLFVHSNDKRFKQISRRAHWQAFLGKMLLQLPRLQPTLLPVCDKNPLSRCFIAADGSVAPCVFLSPPAADREEQWFTADGSFPAPAQRFGSLHEEGLDKIWQSSGYRAFRTLFQQRLLLYEQEMAGVGIDLDAIEKLEQAQKRIRKAFVNMPVPECCRRCPKMKGF